jgi:hypothetical protein
MEDGAIGHAGKGERQGDSHIPLILHQMGYEYMNPDTHCHMLSAAPSPKIPVVVALTNVGSCHLVASSSRERYRRALPVRALSESQKQSYVQYEKSLSRTGGWER